ncbi:Vascular endothelial growth factor receptor 1 [Orchesella cincta]|uniref:Vascular endothelial growth factor receptor 1 n=1 Tax=Orchesella cincta TaxID=48709 RepID=A0A1D2N5B6_ORCCI|nr:Vascular endothelial growth factor receptor 1 [Orchesella cincta]
MPSLGTSIKQDAFHRNKFDTIRLIAWSIEIAEGMDYLASKRVIHGDLSARNVLLSPNLTAKISDFGLSRKLYGYSQYTRNSHEHEALPWRWLALESLKNLEFSTASDVWSWGILAWEIFSLGEQPYPGVSSMTNNFVINLEQGLRPTIPPYATSDCYNIMSSCWDENPKQRPSFSTLRSSLSEIQEVCKTKISLCSSTTKVDNETIGYYQF